MKRLRLAFALATIAGGMLAAATATVVALDLSLVVTVWVKAADNVLPIAKAVLSTVAAVIGIYLVAVPLHRHLPLANFVRYLEHKLGKGSYLLAACELAESRERGHQSEASPILLEKVGEEALAELRPLRATSLRSFNMLFYCAILFTALMAASLLWAMSSPETVKGAMTRLLATNVHKTRPTSSHTQEGVRPTPPVSQLAPPCKALTVSLAPPAYLGQEAFTIGWGGKAQVVAGTTVEITCKGTVGGGQLVLEEHRLARIDSHPFEIPESSGPKTALTAGAVVTEDCEFFVSGGQPGRLQPGKLGFAVVKDSPPTCAIVQPTALTTVEPTGTISLLVEAVDDAGIAAVSVRYLVPGLDSVPTAIELARPDGQRRVLVQRDLPVSSFGADPSDRVELFVEVLDINSFSGPGVCSTATRQLLVTSHHDDQRQLVLTLATLRGQAVDMVGALLALPKKQESTEAAATRFEQDLAAYADSLEQASALMSSIGLFKQEDARRVSTLSASIEEIAMMAEEGGQQPDRVQALWQEGRRELEQHAVVLDGVVDKLRGEYLFYLSGRIGSELNKLQAIRREAGANAGTTRSMRRGFRKLTRLADRALKLKGSTEPVMPALFTSTLPGRGQDWFSRLAEVARNLGDGDGNRDPKLLEEGLEELAMAAERAAQSVEGAYAQSINRFSSSFHNAQLEMVQRFKLALEEHQAIQKELDALILEVQSKTKDYIKRRKTMESVRDVARKTRQVTRVARKFRAATYLKVDRKQVVEFRDKLARLSEYVALLKLEEATALSRDLVALTQSMEFSLKLPIKYSDDKNLIRRSRRELEKVREARKLVETVSARLSMLRPQRRKLLSLRTEDLERIGTKLDKFHLQLNQIRDKVSALSKMFPIFFARFTPALESVLDALSQTRGALSALMLEDASRLTVFMGETMTRLLDTLENAAKSAKTASALVAGGSQPSFEMAGKEETVSQEKLERFMEYGIALGGRKEWQEVVQAYFSHLSH